MLAASLRTPRNCAELSRANEEVPWVEKLPNKLLLLSKAQIDAVNKKVSSTAICVPAAATGRSKVIVSGPGFPAAGGGAGIDKPDLV
ncbi:hypothetical protein Osc7112_0528 [Oscillatoria nigro-viridis PCC 7112]|uniref:Uncharacterized protein n=1 Tax=Phormidium nigroviride PCC 7112 TaxID=179408 RepID=K9VD15_9CYAN|nr:hypothetical protein Osc7112_0528 [Oscillatoria nigro-viridis PCC 7112]